MKLQTRQAPSQQGWRILRDRIRRTTAVGWTSKKVGVRGWVGRGSGLCSSPPFSSPVIGSTEPSLLSLAHQLGEGDEQALEEGGGEGSRDLR